MSNAAKQIEREFQEKLRTNHLFKEFVELHDEASMSELLDTWAWVQKLMEKVIARTIRDLTGPPAAPKLHHKKDR